MQPSPADLFYYYRVPTALLELEGKDVVRYLQNRLTCNIVKLKVGDTTDGLALNSQGKIQALFRVIRKAENNFIILGENQGIDELTSVILQYKVADRININQATSGNIFRIFGDKILLCDKLDIAKDTVDNTFNESNFIGLPFGLDLGIDLFYKTATFNSNLSVDNGFCLMTENEITFTRVFLNIPLFPIDINDGMNGAECSRISSLIASDKGCYVGQEVVEKAITLGRAPRKVRRIAFSDDFLIKIGDSVELETGSGKDLKSVIGGKILSVAYGSNRDKGLQLNFSSNLKDKILCFVLIKNIPFNQIKYNETIATEILSS
jgi:tRNA-modifying protein YgfZ